MKRFILHAFLFLLVTSVFFVIIGIIYSRYYAPDLYMKEFPVKGRLISQTPSPKIVLLGGSNVAFGIDSQMISDSLHLPVVNAGLHAGIGLKYTMDSYFKLFKKEDILIIMPEYSNFFGNANGESGPLGEILYCELPNITKLNFEQYKNMLTGYMVNTISNYYNIIRNPSQKTELNFYEYRMSGFNQWGDGVSNWTIPHKECTITIQKISNPLDEKYCQHFLSQINELAAKGVKVILLPPATYEENVSLNKEAISQLYTTLSTFQESRTGIFCFT